MTRRQDIFEKRLRELLQKNTAFQVITTKKPESGKVRILCLSDAGDKSDDQSVSGEYIGIAATQPTTVRVNPCLWMCEVTILLTTPAGPDGTDLMNTWQAWVQEYIAGAAWKTDMAKTGDDFRIVQFSVPSCADDIDQESDSRRAAYTISIKFTEQ